MANFDFSHVLSKEDISKMQKPKLTLEARIEKMKREHEERMKVLDKLLEKKEETVS